MGSRWEEFQDTSTRQRYKVLPGPGQSRMRQRLNVELSELKVAEVQSQTIRASIQVQADQEYAGADSEDIRIAMNRDDMICVICGMWNESESMLVGKVTEKSTNLQVSGGTEVIYII